MPVEEQPSLPDSPPPTSSLGRISNVFANAVLLSAAAFFAALLAYSLKTGDPYSYAAKLQTVLAVAAAGSLASLLMPVRIKANFSVLVLATGASLLIGEMALDFSVRTASAPYLLAAKAQGVDVDERSKSEVVADLRAEGVEAFPLVLPGMFVRSRNELTVGDVNPLGSISDATLVWCNESGEMTVYQSDERGFRNPKGVWGSQDIEIVLIGDSFVNGACVPSDADIASTI